jgi:hypothetical protein
MDQLEKIIEEKKAFVDVMRRLVQNPSLIRSTFEKASAELEALQLAASLRPLPGQPERSSSEEKPPNRPNPLKRGGKLPGTISGQWRDLLRRMYADGNPYRTNEWILAAAVKAKIDAKQPKSIIDRLSRKYVTALKFLEYEEGQGFRVTQLAVDRFKFDSGGR